MFTFYFRHQNGWKTTFWKWPLLNSIWVIQLGRCHIHMTLEQVEICLQRALVRGQTPTSTTAFDRWVERLHKSERLETSCYQSTTAFDREEHWGRWLHWGRTGSETRSKRWRVGGGERWPGCPKKEKPHLGSVFKTQIQVFCSHFHFLGTTIATSFVYWEVLSVILKPLCEQEARPRNMLWRK